MTITGQAAASAAGAQEAAALWHVLREGRQYGPFAVETLIGHWKSGALKGDDQIWSPVAQRWLPPAEALAAASATPTPTPTPTEVTSAAGDRSGDAEPEDTDEAPAASRLSVRRKGAAVLYATLIIVMMSLSLVSCFQFIDEGNAKVETFALDGTRENALTLAVQIVETDLVREQMRLYIAPRLNGTLADKSPRLPARDIELTLASVTGPRVMMLKRAHHLEPFDLEIPLSDGHILLYPMDRYQAWIEAEALIAATGDGKPEIVPVVIEMNPRNHAVHVVPRLSKQAEAGDLVLRLTVSRLLPIVIFTWFMAGVAAVLSLTAVLVVIAVITGRRKPELGMLGWLTALLFALPAVRNSLPGAPPLGAFIDYSAFFWAEALVGISMLVLVALWFINREQLG